jgi:hypothetical protein
MPQSQQQRHRPLLAFAASNFQDIFSCLWAWRKTGSPASLRPLWYMSMHTASLCYGRQETKCMKRVEGWMKKKSVEDLEDHRCHLPTVRSPTAECIMQRTPSRLAIYRYFDVQGFVSSQESPLPFLLRIIKKSSREVPSSPRTAWFARHIKSIGHIANFSDCSGEEEVGR